MYKIYFKQAVRLLKQTPFISIVSILGTALAITMIMTIIVSDEIKTIPVVPEINRDRTLYILSEFTERTKDQWTFMNDVSIARNKEYLSEMKTPELVSMINHLNPMEYFLVRRQGPGKHIKSIVRRTDSNYWKIYSFSFMEGKPFNAETFESGIKEAVISEKLSKKLFKGESATGNTILINQVPYRVTGVVKDVSVAFSHAYGDIWIPYTSQQRFMQQEGGYIVILLAKSKTDFPAITEEIREIEKKHDNDHKDWKLYLRGPETHTQQVAKIDGYITSPESFNEMVHATNFKKTLIFIILFMIPAINLSGFSMSRIRKRIEEIGIRKTFGAKKYTILIQVLYENFITSVTGGIIGFIFSYIAVFSMKEWLLDIPPGQEHFISYNSLMSSPLLFSVVLVCIILNILSAGIPAWKASRTNIINSLTQNDKAL